MKLYTGFLKTYIPAVGISFEFACDLILIDFSNAKPSSRPKSFFEALPCIEHSSKGSSSGSIVVAALFVKRRSFGPSISTSKSTGTCARPKHSRNSKN